MAKDLLATLADEWNGRKTTAKVESLGNVEVEIKPLPYSARMRLQREKEDAYGDLVLQYIRKANGAELFDGQDDTKKRKAIQRKLGEEVNPDILLELVGLLFEQFGVEDVEKGKARSEEQTAST